jgi:hypothetical protein
MYRIVPGASLQTPCAIRGSLRTTLNQQFDRNELWNRADDVHAKVKKLEPKILTNIKADIHALRSRLED